MRSVSKGEGASLRSTDPHPSSFETRLTPLLGMRVASFEMDLLSSSG